MICLLFKIDLFHTLGLSLSDEISGGIICG